MNIGGGQQTIHLVEDMRRVQRQLRNLSDSYLSAADLFRARAKLAPRLPDPGTPWAEAQAMLWLLWAQYMRLPIRLRDKAWMLGVKRVS